MTEHYPNILWKAEILTNEIVYLTEMSKNVERVDLFLLIVYMKMQKKWGELKKELLSKEEQEFRELGEKIPAYHYCKTWENLFWK